MSVPFQENAVRVIGGKTPLPFALPDLDAVVPAGRSLADILADHRDVVAWTPELRVQLVSPERPDHPWTVDPSLWHAVRPHPGTIVLAGIVPGKGGGGGGKSATRMVLSIAVMVAAFAVGAYVGGLGIGPEFTMFGKTFNLLGMAAGAATSMLGNALVSALVPPATPRLSEISYQTGSVYKDEPVYTITGARNAPRPWAPKRIVCGRRRVFPDEGAETYVEVRGGKTYLRMLLEVGVGPLKMSEWKVGETPFEDLTGIELEVREGWSTDEPLTLYTDDIHQEVLSVHLTNESGWHTRRSSIDADELIVDFVFDRGLVKFTGTNSRDAVTVSFEVEISPAGEDTWSAVTWANADDAGFGTAGQATVTDTVAGGEVRRSGRIKLATQGQYDVRIRRTTADSTSNDTVDSSYWGALRTLTYRDPIAEPGLARAALLIEAGEEAQGVIDTVNCLVESYYEVYDDATQTWSWQLSRDPSDAFIHRLRYHRRPVDVSRINLDVMMAWRDACQALNAEGEPKFQFDAVYEADTSLRALLMDICAAGRARLGMPDGKWGVVEDTAQTVPVQAFGPSNSWGFRETETYVDLPHAVRVRFEDEDAGYRVTTDTVYADGYDAASAEDFEVMETLGVVRWGQAWALGRYFLAEGKLRPSTYTWKTDVEGFDCDRGQLVAVAHPVLSVGLGEGRVKAITRDGGTPDQVIEIQLDERVVMEAGKTYGVRIRRAGAGERVPDTRIVKTEAGETDTLKFWDNDLGQALPVPLAIEPAEGDLVFFGEAGQETLDVIVHGIEPEAGGVVSITAKDAAPAIHDADTGTIPERDLVMTKPAVALRKPAKPAVASVVSDESVLQPLAGGGWQPRIRVNLEPRDTADPPADYLEARIRRTDSEVFARRSPLPVSGVLDFSEVDQGVAYRIEIRAVTAYGQVSDWAVIDSHTVIGKGSPPPDPEALYIEALPDGRLRLRVAGAVAVDHAGWRFAWRPGLVFQWAGAVPLHAGVSTVEVLEIAPPTDGTFTILVQAVDVDGNPSVGTAHAVARLGDRVADDVVETTDYAAAGFPGTITGGSVVGGDLTATASAALFDDPAAALFDDPAAALFDGYDTLIYEDTLKPTRDGFLVMPLDADGAATLEYQAAGDDPLYTNPAHPLLDDLADPLFDPRPMIAYAGPFGVRAGVDYGIRATIPGGPVKGVVRVLRGDIEVPMESEVLTDVAIDAAGTRLAPTRAWAEILKVDLTVQEAPGYPAEWAKAVDKAVSGPLIQGYDGSGAAAALVDATIKGIPAS